MIVTPAIVGRIVVVEPTPLSTFVPTSAVIAEGFGAGVAPGSRKRAPSPSGIPRLARAREASLDGARRRRLAAGRASEAGPGDVILLGIPILASSSGPRRRAAPRRSPPHRDRR